MAQGMFGNDGPVVISRSILGSFQKRTHTIFLQVAPTSGLCLLLIASSP